MLTNDDIGALVRGLLPSVVDYVNGLVEVIAARVKALEERSPLPGRDGIDGKDGTDGINGKDGVDGKDGIQGTDGRDGEDGRDGINGMDGKDGIDAKDGVDGTNGRDGENGRDGIDGKDGEDGKDGIDGKDGVDGTNGQDGESGRDGIDGKDGRDAIDGKDGRDGRDGKDGRDGIDGRDASDLDVLPAIDFNRVYGRGTLASHRSGLWRAFTNTDGEHGWACIVDGVDGIGIEAEERGFVISITRSTSAVQTFRCAMPALLYRGVYEYGRRYDTGDVVTFAGSLWHCNASTGAKPDERTDDAIKPWTLAVKRGRDGKDASLRIVQGEQA